MSNVQVFCRCKPSQIQQTLQNKQLNKVEVLNENNIQINSLKNEKLNFIFDYIFNEITTQEEVYLHILPLIKETINGYNGTIFTYGQTGSGKTYTMHGIEGTNNQGIIPRTIQTLFETIEQTSLKIKATLSVSCLEIYQEKLFDLLNENVSKSHHNIPLRIRQTSIGSVWVEGLIERVFSNSSEFYQLFSIATKRRSVGSHLMNSESSRSHFCCIINIQIITISNGEKVNSKLHLIDLAGSEMVNKTSANGTRLNEAKYINKSLSALGNVINALTSSSSSSSSSLSSSTTILESISNNNSINLNTTTGNNTIPVIDSCIKHIPYRDSKLTRLLQDSLSGNSKTIMLLTISTSIEHLQETIATLRFGERARKLKTKPQINIEKNDLNYYKTNYNKIEKQLFALKYTIDELKIELQNRDNEINQLKNENNNNIRNSNSNSNSNRIDSCCNCQKYEQEILILQKRIEELEYNEQNRKFLQNKNKIKNSNKQEMKIIKNKDQKNSDKINNLENETVIDSNDSEEEESNENEEENEEDEEENENDESDENNPILLPYDENRCAICGLNELETTQLYEDTGENLGGYFTCDGNCGNKFHVRCAGEIGDGGQYTVPSGEWYCTSCSVLDDDENIIKTTPIKKSNSIIINQTENENKNKNSRNNSVNNSVNNSISVFDSISSNTSFHNNNNNDNNNNMTNNESEHLVRVLSEYHKMRRERNRILNQWQHEQKLLKHSNQIREKREYEQEQELIAAKEIINKLQDDVLGGHREQKRLEKLLNETMDNFLKEKNERKKEEELRKKFELECTELNIIKKKSFQHLFDDQNNNNANNTNNTNNNQNEITTNNQSPRSKELKNKNNSINSNSSGIPKPWLKKSSSLNSSTKSSNNGNINDNTITDSATITKLPVDNLVNVNHHSLQPKRFIPSPIRHINSHSNNYDDNNNYNNNNEDIQTITNNSNNIDDNIDSNNNNSNNMNDLILNSSKSSTPFNKRLLNLIQSVKEETGSYVEIRKKYQDRENERNMLKSQQNTHGKNNRINEEKKRIFPTI